MSEGELLQIEKRDDLILLKIFITKLSEKNCNTYRCLLCARSAIVIDDELQVENMRKFGELIGMAFQIKTICLIILMKR
jgi:octaprenyl-diphosphate synthase